MTKPLGHRRRAERFAQLLEEADGARRHRRRSPVDDELAELVMVRHELVRTPPPEVDPEFRTGLRAMLVATAEREGIGATAQPAPPDPAPAERRRRSLAGALARGPRARTAVVAGVAVGAVAFAGMSTASENAVPGDTLYGVKRSAERAQLALASSDVGRAQLYLDFAQTRLAEAGAVADGLDRVLADMDRDTQAGVKLLTTVAANRQDPTALDPIDRFVTDQRYTLQALADVVSDSGEEPFRTSLELLDDVEQRASELRRNLDLECPSATSVDALGPLPGACLTLPAPDALSPSEASSAEAPASQPGTGSEPEQPRDGQDPAADEEPAAEPDDRSDDSASSPSGSSSTGEDPDSDEPDAEEDPAEDEAEQSAEDDGGLLSSLNRLLGNLLGG